MKLLFYIFSIFIVSTFNANAQVEYTNEISVFAEICEKIINNESKASARIRATDKASFQAVENIPELSQYRSQLDTHKFNLNIYKLVDNYLEDLKMVVTNQDDNRVCVEITAYLPSTSINEVFNSNEISNKTNEVQENDEFVLEVEGVETEGAISIPPKPEIVINKEIAYNNIDEVTTSSNTNLSEQDTVVFVDETDFYNGVSTKGFYTTLKQNLNNKPGIKVISSKNNPDYIIKPKILKARVDNINSETGRLQLVVALDLTDTANGETITEHQNRFVLFAFSEDTQKTAANLAKKLFAEGIQKLLPKIKTSPQTTSSIITPN